jgi:2-polyprenyl-3-methyl-5-hydroxy-6-metoxy-1,4-benzoquinol methylase
MELVLRGRDRLYRQTRVTGLELVGRRGDDYGSLRHDAKIALLREPLGWVLDVGCARGANADALRARGATHVAGIEFDEEFAAAAREHYDQVVHGSVPEDLSWPGESFDTILAYDVLEHLVDPWTAVRRLAALLKPGGRLHVSLPNARSKKLWLPLILRGTFAYEPEGIMDVTHLRFFTRRDAIALVEGAGLRVESVEHPPPETTKRRVAYKLGLAEFLTIQWFLLARTDLSDSAESRQ